MNMNTTELTAGAFKARIMEADRLIGNHDFDLPPGSPLLAYRVDQFIVRPEHWIPGDGSWVVVVRANKGLWFDWRSNNKYNTAVVPSIKGCNPITGLETVGFTLEQYSNCPRHPNIKLNENHFCSECGYTQPVQNFIAAPNYLWWDGFRSDDGKVRQFFFTEDEKRDVATHLIGKENTVPAFGFAFYTKKPEFMTQPTPPIVHRVNDMTYYKSMVKSKSCTNYNKVEMDVMYCDTNNSMMKLSASLGDNNLTNSYAEDLSICHVEKSRGIVAKAKDVSVGAGASIKQSLHKSSDVNTWKDTPDAVMRIYFIFESEFTEYRKHGMKFLEDVVASPLKGIPVG